MKHILRLTVCLLLLSAQFACHKQDINTEQNIEGLWHRTINESAESIYEFRETGALTVKTVGFGRVIYTNEYAYWVTPDSLKLYDYEDNLYSNYGLTRVTDDTLVLKLNKMFEITLIKF